MKLINDYATPLELSTVARLALIQRERNENKLSEFLPTENVDGTTITLASAQDGRVEVAEYRAFDAETSFGSTASPARGQIVELAALGQQARVSEYDRLAARNAAAPARVKDALGKTAATLGQAVADRLEAARGQVLQTGKLTISENGFKAEVDFGRDASMQVNAATPWSDSTVDVVDDYINWVQAYIDLNGEAPEYAVASTQAINAFKKSEAFTKAVVGGQIYASRITLADVQGFLEDEGLPTLRAYNRKVLRNGVNQNVIDPAYMVFVPPASSRAGSTAMGTTLESLSPRYGMVAGEESGIVVGAFESDNPMGLYVNSAAIALPVLHEANKFMTAKVL